MHRLSDVFRGYGNVKLDGSMIIQYKAVSPFHASGLFIYPLKTSETHRFSDDFRGTERDQLEEMGSGTTLILLCIYYLTYLRQMSPFNTPEKTRNSKVLGGYRKETFT